MNEVYLIIGIIATGIYFYISAKNKIKNRKLFAYQKINANNFINGMSEYNQDIVQSNRTFKTGFTAAKAKDGTYIFIKQCKLVDTGIF